MSETAPRTAADMLRIMEAIRKAFAPVVAQRVEMLRQMHTAMRPLVELYEQKPYLFPQPPDPELHLGSCHCLCGTHREQAEGVCTSYAERGLTLEFRSPTVGTQHVRMCRPCYQANLDLRAAQTPEHDAIEAPTDTCTCHCWRNHPAASGVCEAAPTPGVMIGGQPACPECRNATPVGRTAR